MEIPLKTPPATGPVFGRLICFVLYRESVECIMFNYIGPDVCGASINVWSWHTLAPARLRTGKLPLSQNQTRQIFHIFKLVFASLLQLRQQQTIKTLDTAELQNVIKCGAKSLNQILLQEKHIDGGNFGALIEQT